MVRPGLCARTECTTPCELVNSVMISPQPPSPRINRRKTVSVTPAIGASTVAGAISTPPILSFAGKCILDTILDKQPSPLSDLQPKTLPKNRSRAWFRLTADG